MQACTPDELNQKLYGWSQTSKQFFNSLGDSGVQATENQWNRAHLHYCNSLLTNPYLSPVSPPCSLKWKGGVQWCESQMGQIMQKVVYHAKQFEFCSLDNGELVKVFNQRVNMIRNSSLKQNFWQNGIEGVDLE